MASISFRHFSSSSANDGSGHSTRAAGPTLAAPETSVSCAAAAAFVVPSTVDFVASSSVVVVVAASVVVASVAVTRRCLSTLSHAPQASHLPGRGTRTGQATGARARRRLEQPGQRATIEKKSSGGGVIIFFF